MTCSESCTARRLEKAGEIMPGEIYVLVCDCKPASSAVRWAKRIFGPDEKVKEDIRRIIYNDKEMG